MYRTISSDMSETFCNVLPLKVALFVSMIHIIYTSTLCGYLLPYFIIYGFSIDKVYAYICAFQPSRQRKQVTPVETALRHYNDLLDTTITSLWRLLYKTTITSLWRLL